MAHGREPTATRLPLRPIGDIAPIIGPMYRRMLVALLSIGCCAQDPPEVTNAVWRTLVMGTHGMVAAEHPLQARAGLHVLESGGNAFDAAAAVFYMTSVVEQH